MAMNENNSNLVLRAKRQAHRESAIRSFLLAGVCVTAGLQLFGIDLPFIHTLLFLILFISLVLNSDVIANFGLVTKRDLVKVIDQHIHNDPKVLTRYTEVKKRP